MLVAFTLTMPGVGSWNGRWTGENRLHVKVRNLGQSRAARERVAPLLGESFGYAWSDGWRADVSVREVDASEARRLRAKSQGFCGYEWMIDSLLRDGRIVAPSDRKQETTTERSRP